jgi:hypothetical protein
MAVLASKQFHHDLAPYLQKKALLIRLVGVSQEATREF